MNLFGSSSDVKTVATDQDGGFELFAKVGEVLQARGLGVGHGTSWSHYSKGAPSSAEIAGKARDPETFTTGVP